MESEEEAEKRLLIEDAFENPHTNLNSWRNLAVTPYGLIAGEYFFKHLALSNFPYVWNIIYSPYGGSMKTIVVIMVVQTTDHLSEQV